jgi:hypothetical protein
MDDKRNTGQNEDDKPVRGDRPAESDTGGSSADVQAPFAPHEDDDSAVGDSDQHSTA